MTSSSDESAQAKVRSAALHVAKGGQRKLIRIKSRFGPELEDAGAG